MRSIVRVAAPLGIAAIATGCGSSSTSPTPAPAGTTVNVTLAHVPTGQATLTLDRAKKELTVAVRLTGLAPGSAHPAHIHAGSCAHQGDVVHPLTALTADDHGVATSTTTVSGVADSSIPSGQWYVNVHNGPGLTPDEQLQPIACGDVTPSGADATSVTVPLTEGPPPPSQPGSPDQHASGTAALSLSDGQLHVSLDVRDLAPGSTHAAHIHRGSCESQGGVVHPLDILRADGSGHATETKVIPAPGLSAIPSGQWYVNVHRVADISTGQTAFDPIVCGNVNG